MSRLFLMVLALAVLTTGCIRKFAINKLGDALAKSGTTFASDDDPDLIQDAGQDRKEFQALLDQALAIDVNSKPEWRLNNPVTQRRARWLLGRADQLFVE